jgi:ribosomal protein S18 acetylase RimI-like enzyme
MSLYAEYLKEKTSDQIIENEKGFITYRYVDEHTVYIIDLFILPEFRRDHIASLLADSIVEEAKKKGCIKLLGSVVPSNKNSTASLKVLLGYGMVLESSSNDFIIFRKGI